MAGKGTRVKYIGPGDRFMGELPDGEWTCSWTAANNHIVRVADTDILDDIIHYPRPQFRILDDVEEQPAASSPKVIAGIGDARVVDLAEHDIFNVGDLAALDAAGIEHLATHSGASRGQIQNWVAAAQAITED